MIPRTYPSRVNSTTGRVEALVSFISSTTGLQRWVDYTPVSFVTDATPVEGSYNNNGYIAVADVGSTTGLQAGKDYIRVYLDPNATDAWRVNSVGFIPVGYSGIGGIPYALFANNEQGVWYDPSDTATLFQDSAGTTPVTAVEQPVGLMLDKSKGLVLGSELVTNGDFSGGTADWTNRSTGAGTFSVSGGAAVVTGVDGASRGWFTQTRTTVVGAYYKISFDYTHTSGTVNLIFGSTSGTGSLSLTSSGPKTIYLVASSTTTFIGFQTASGGGNGSIDNISVRELPGNHAFQATSTSRPVLSARYNLLTKTEQFDDATFSKKNLTITANAATAPNGTLSADLAVPDNVSTTHYVFFPSISTSAACTASVYVQAAGLTKVALRESASAGSYASFDLATGTVIETGSVAPGSVSNATITSVGSGWFRISANFSGTSSQLIGIWPLPNSYTTGNPVATWASDGVNGLRLWGADLRVTNDAAGQPAYQRVNTAADYDTPGFKPYLRFDGTDDWLQTNSINFTATDKMTVFAGMRKLSDAAQGVVAELSATIVSNNGAFLLASPDGATQTYGWDSKGTVQVDAVASSLVAPRTNIVVGIADISGDSASIRVNGTVSDTDTGDQGTGNYGNYPLYIGRRGGTTLPFNGRIYGLIVRGAATTTETIQATETYMNGKTGAY